jgi:dephospho-CoA kinase
VILMKSDCDDFRIIGLTGGIATGKSFIAKLFQEYGVKILDADLVGRKLLEPHKPCWQALENEFGEVFFDAENRVNRPALRKAIFSDEVIRNTINSLFHPLIRDGIAQEIEKYIHKFHVVGSPELIVVEVPPLFESGWMADFDTVIVVAADKETCIQRVMTRDGVTRAESEAAIRVQMPLGEKVELADMVIDNNGDVEGARRQVEHILQELGREC